MRAISLFAFFLLAGLSPLLAGETPVVRNWNHPDFTGSWFDATRWDPAGVPDSDDWVQLQEGSVEITARAAEADVVNVGTEIDTTAELTISSGGTLTSGPNNAVLGTRWNIAGASTGVVSVTGAGSQWAINSELIVGGPGNASLSVTAGGSVTSLGAVVAQSKYSEANLVIDGLGSTDLFPSIWFNLQELAVGARGSGEVTLTNAGRMITGGSATIGSFASGTVTIENPGSEWRLRDTLVIGKESSGNGSVTVRDQATILTKQEPLVVGKAGTGTMTLASGAVIKPEFPSDAPQLVELAAESGSAGTLNIGEGGEPGLLEVAGIDGGAGTAVINFNHNSPDYHFSTYGTTTGDPVPIGGSAAVNLLGGGTTVLRGAHDYTGATLVKEGSTLRLDGTLGDTAVTVTDGARLEGAGVIAGPVTVESTASLAPGLSAGTVQMDSLTLIAGSDLDFELGPAGTVGAGVNDLIEIEGDLILDGRLNVTDLDDFGPGVYTLMTYGATLTDNGLDIAPLPGGVPATIDLTTPGEVRLVVEPLAPVVALFPVSFNFGTVMVGQSSPAPAGTIENTGNIDLSLGTLAIDGPDAGDFALLADTCSGQTLPPGTNCSYQVQFSPGEAGARSAEVTIPSNAPTSPDRVALSGTGLALPELWLSPSWMDFGDQPLGAPTAPEVITIMNIGPGDLQLDLLALTGLHPNDYMVLTDGCSGAVLATDETCQVELDFAPLAPGVRQAELAIPSNDPAGPHAVELLGTHDVMFFDGFEQLP